MRTLYFDGGPGRTLRPDLSRCRKLLDDAHLVPAIECGMATTARPRPLAAAPDRLAAGRALIQVLHWPSRDRLEGGPDLLRRGASQCRDTNRDPVVPMMGVAAVIAVEMIPHVDQFFSHDQLDRSRLAEIDTFEIDEHGMCPRLPDKTIGAPVCGRNLSSDPRPVGASLRRHHQVIDRERQFSGVAVDQFGYMWIAVVEFHLAPGRSYGHVQGSID